jgi:hypothetical protein
VELGLLHASRADHLEANRAHDHPRVGLVGLHARERNVPREKSDPVFRKVSAALYGGCMRPLVPVLITKSYTLDKMQYLTGEQQLYPISAATVHLMSCFHDTSIRAVKTIEVDKNREKVEVDKNR